MKKALIVILVIVVIGAVLFFVPKAVHVERSISIQAPVEVVFDQVSDLKKNFNWSPWGEKDPNMKVEYGEITSGMGASYSWSGNDDVGSGTLVVSEYRENEFIKNDLDFGDMGQGNGTWNFSSNEDGSVEVTWGMDTEVPLLFAMMMDGMVGADFELGLSNLKELAESMPAKPAVEISETDVEGMMILAIKDSVSTDYATMEEAMTNMYGALGKFMEENAIEMSGHAMAIFHEWKPEEGYTIFEAAIPVGEGVEIEVSDNITHREMPACKAAMTTHIGGYKSSGAAHMALGEWVGTNQREITGPVWEEYVVGPFSEQDSTKWETKIYYPIM